MKRLKEFLLPTKKPLDKSAMSFSSNVTEDIIDAARNILQVPVMACHERYLGLPTVVGRNQRSLFLTVQERVKRKVQGWKEIYLSNAGKEILNKSVAQAVPTYSMSCFRMPVVKELHSILAKFWWGKSNGEKGIHWRRWEFLCRSKKFGRLGFRIIEDFNQALFAKQVWRVFMTPNSLTSSIFRARYFPGGSVLDGNVRVYPSFVWKSLL